MPFLEFNGDGLAVLFILLALFWAVPVIMFIVGLVLLVTKRSPKTGKVLLIISGIWLVIGLGVCGALMM